jgi:hypothetical protein
MREELQQVFEHRDWSRGTEGVSKSGFNASLRATRRLRAALPRLFATYQVRRFVDAPCGDFFWMQHVDLTGVEYWGWEISKTLNDFNQQFASARRHFALGDITSDPLPDADMLMVRDCLVHLTFEMRWAFFDNFLAANIPWLLVTSWLRPENRWVYKNGGEKSFNMQAEPFSFGPPVEFILETADTLPAGEETNPETTHRGMGLWPRSAIAARVAAFKAAGSPIIPPRKAQE